MISKFMKMLVLTLALSPIGNAAHADLLQSPIFCVSRNQAFSIVSSEVGLSQQADGTYAFRGYGGPAKTYRAGANTVYEYLNRTISGTVLRHLEFATQPDPVTGLHAGKMIYGGTTGDPVNCRLYPGQQVSIVLISHHSGDVPTEVELYDQAVKECKGSVIALEMPTFGRHPVFSPETQVVSSGLQAFLCGETEPNKACERKCQGFPPGFNHTCLMTCYGE